MAGMNDRGQILLIGALVMAITFVSLGIVLNSSLHTPSVAAQASDDITSNELSEIQNTIQREGAELMKGTDDESVVENNISSLGDELAAYYARQDAVVNVTKVNATTGMNVTGNSSASFSVKNVRMLNVNTSRIGDYNITLHDGSQYVIDVTDDRLSVNGETCTYSSRINSVEVTNATTDRGPCGALEFVEDLGTDYDLHINSTVSGSVGYEFIGHGVSNTSNTSYTNQSVVYDVQVPVTIHSPSLTYNGTIEVAPGEP